MFLCRSITVLVVSFLFTGAQSFPHSSCLLYRLEPHGLPQRDADMQWPEIQWFVSFLGGCLTSKAALSLHQLTQGLRFFLLWSSVWPKLSPGDRMQGQQWQCWQVRQKLHTLIPLTFQWAEMSPEAPPHCWKLRNVVSSRADVCPGRQKKET